MTTSTSTVTFTPYLNFDGRTKEAFEFYAKVFDGTVSSMMPFAGSPMAGEVPPEWGNRIMHASMDVGGSLLMASDSPPGQHEKPAGLWVSIHLRDVSRAERIFRALADGGSITMPLEKTFWAERFGMCTDRFGTPWMINCEAGG